MYTVIGAPRNRTFRVIWLLEELGEPYQVIRYERDRKTMHAPATLRAIHPLGRSPVVQVDGHALIETGAIMEYLVARAGRFRRCSRCSS